MSAKDYQGASIVRAPHNNAYFIMSRKTAQDEKLSFEARGMIAYLLSKPDTWEIQVHDLKQKCAKGRVYRILDELTENGYLKPRTKYRNEKGQWEWTPYVLHERPIIKIPENTDTDNAEIKEDDKPLPEKRDTDKPDTDKPDTDNAEILDSTELDNTDKNIAPSAKSKKPQELLGDAFGVQPITSQDFGLYGKVCKQLSEANIEPSEYAEYVSWVKRLAKGTGGWKVTIPSLISGGRVSDYVSTKQVNGKKELKTPEQDLQELGQQHILSILTGDMEESA